jgi:hypothetical protein
MEPIQHNSNVDQKIQAKRFPQNPIIKPGMRGLEGKLDFMTSLKMLAYLGKRLIRKTHLSYRHQLYLTLRGSNINGPSLIQVPDWIDNPLGKYYLYFAHHQGEYIRLAYADQLEGPWKIYQPGTLHVDQTAGFDHVASPDVHIDKDTQQIRMYFHTPCQGHGQITMIATSKDGLHFTASPEVLGPFYFRVFQYGGVYYAIAKNKNTGGLLLRSHNGLTKFEVGKELIPNLRHTAVWVQGDTLLLFYSTIGDQPEHIQMSFIDLSKDWQHWEPSSPISILKPEMDYEGINLPLEPSILGPAMKPVRQLRDPAIYLEGDKSYLLYSTQGEQGIAIAQLILKIQEIHEE